MAVDSKLSTDETNVRGNESESEEKAKVMCMIFVKWTQCITMICLFSLVAHTE